MFNKNTKITFEILPDGKVLIETYLSKDVNPDRFSSMINNLLCRNYLQEMILSINKAAAGKSDLVDKICGNVYEVQKNIDLTPKVITKRNPLIKPDEVFKAYQGDQ